MKELRQHLDQVVSEGLKPEFTARVVATVHAERHSGHTVFWEPMIALACGLILSIGTAALHQVLIGSVEIELDHSWSEVIRTAKIVRFHL